MVAHDACRIVKRPDGTDWELGTGNFGKVLRGIRDDVQPVAVKSMFRRDRSMEEAFIREIAMMKCVHRRTCVG
jgi:Protein tyrosine and serine/threonine kinase